MSRQLSGLSAAFRPLAAELIARCVEGGIQVMIITTSRTVEEQAEHVKDGTSWTMQSKHLTGDAIDLAPLKSYQLDGPDAIEWDGDHPAYAAMGRMGEDLGLVWGGRWKQWWWGAQSCM